MKRLKGIIVAVILSLASILMPFNIYADTITTANIVGVSAVVSDSLVNGQVTYNSQTFNTYFVNYDVEIIFDQAYLGYVQLTLEYDYSTRDSSGIVERTNNQTRRVFVNGTSAHINLNIFSSYSNNPLLVTYNNPRVSTITTGSTNVTPIGDLADIQQIVEILQDIYSLEGDIEGLENNQLLQLQQVVANTSLANQYLETLSKLRQWNIFPESYIYVIYFLRSYNVLEYGNGSYINDINYPVFQVSADDKIGRVYLNPTDNKYLCILWTNRNIYNQSTLESYIGTDSVNGATLQYDSYVYTGYNLVTGSQTKIIKFYINVGSANETVNLVAKNSMQIIPFYLNDAKKTNFTTDFALYFGLSNTLLNNLNIIANGTTQSNSAASDLESGNSQMADDMDDLAIIENGYNQQFNNQLQSIDFTSPIQSNSGILPAANFVITIFNGLINNNPFSVLIIVVCILLIGKKVIGK